MNENITDNTSDSAGDATRSPAEMMALLQAQQRSTSGELGGPVPLILAAWGLAWLVGFLVLWVSGGGVPGVEIPAQTAFTLFATVLSLAVVASIGLGIWSSRGIKSGATSAFQGAVYGVSWSLSLIAAAVIGSGLIENGMSGELASLYFPSVMCLVVGVLYLAGAALWRAIPLLVAGPWLLLIAAVAPYLGAPNNNLLMAIGGGGAFLAVGIAAAVSNSRIRAAADAGGTK